MSGDYLRETLAECGKRAEADLGRVSTWTRSVCKLLTPPIELLDTISIMAPLRFSDAYPYLPATAPTGHPHIITGSFHEETDKTNLRAADGVATFLYNWDPSILDEFLNPAIPQLEIVRKQKRQIMEDMVIAKHGQSVMVSDIETLWGNGQGMYQPC
jgi:hypothetical protein